MYPYLSQQLALIRGEELRQSAENWRRVRRALLARRAGARSTAHPGPAGRLRLPAQRTAEPAAATSAESCYALSATASPVSNGRHAA